VVTQEQYIALKQVSEATGFENRKQVSVANGWVKPEKDGELNFAGARFVVGEIPGIHTEVEKADLEGNLKWIADAREQSDFVAYSMHWHEGGDTPDQPAMFHQGYAKACIDAGVDAFIGHGPHILRGIEIYKRRPIFYSLGNFVFQNETVRKLPADVYEKTDLDHFATPANYYDKRSDKGKKGFPVKSAYWESVMPWCRYKGGDLVELKLYPITLGHGKPRTVRGRPQLAQGELAEKIIQDMIGLSRPFGTDIELVDGIGIVRL